MSAESLLVQKSAQKQLNKLPLHLHKRIIQALKKIKLNPVSGMKLQGQLGNYYKYSVGDYRIVYSYDSSKNTVFIVKIEHRQGVYK